MGTHSALVIPRSADVNHWRNVASAEVPIPHISREARYRRELVIGVAWAFTRGMNQII